jgi:hypothetical protein
MRWLEKKELSPLSIIVTGTTMKKVFTIALVAGNCSLQVIPSLIVAPAGQAFTSLQIKKQSRKAGMYNLGWFDGKYIAANAAATWDMYLKTDLIQQASDIV